MVPEIERDLEWDQVKSDRNRLERDLPFDLAEALFQGPTRESRDLRLDYGEERVRATGMADRLILHWIYTHKDGVRRIISLRRANKGERDAYRKAVQN